MIGYQGRKNTLVDIKRSGSFDPLRTSDNVFYQELAKRGENRLLSVNFRVSFIFFEGFRPDEVENEA